MAKIIRFSAGERILDQGNAADCVAYLIQRGWVDVERSHLGGVITRARLGPGEIVGELGLIGAAPTRTATVTAATDVELEVIDRGALIRMVNGPGGRLVPLLAALFRRLADVLAEDAWVGGEDDTVVVYARIEGASENAREALGGRPVLVDRLPFVLGAYRPPQSVTDLFRGHDRADLALAGAPPVVRERHVAIEADERGALFLRLLNFGDWCKVDGKEIGRTRGLRVPLRPGRHRLAFGDRLDPFVFELRVPGELRGRSVRASSAE